MLLPALGHGSWAGEHSKSQPFPTLFLPASLTLIKLLASRVAPPLPWKVLCSQHVHHMCLQYPRFTTYILCQPHSGSSLGRVWSITRPNISWFAGESWGKASDLYLICFIGLFRARCLPLSVSACSTFTGFGGKNKERVYIYIYIYQGGCVVGAIKAGRCISCTGLQ